MNKLELINFKNSNHRIEFKRKKRSLELVRVTKEDEEVVRHQQPRHQLKAEAVVEVHIKNVFRSFIN